MSSFTGGEKKKPYLIKNPAYQELEPLKWVRDNIVLACPYDGPEKREKEYRKQVNLFFWHVLQSSLYPHRSKRDLKFGSVWVPFGTEFGRKVLPMVFGDKNTESGAVSVRHIQRTEKQFTRALDWLVDNILQVKGHDSEKGLSREFRIRREVLEQMYPFDPKTNDDILSRTRFYSPLNAVQERFGKTILEKIEASAKKPFEKRTHNLSALCSDRDRKDRSLYTEVLGKLDYHDINISEVMAYLEAKSFMKSLRAQRQYHQVLHAVFSIIDGGALQVITEEPLVIRYYPSYTAASIGGRLFEDGGGFQSFPAALKQRSSVSLLEGAGNWDMVSSQLNFIRQAFIEKGIECAFLDDIESVNDIALKVGLPKKVVKICFYATIFSVSELTKSPRSRVVKALRPHFTDIHKVYDFIESWNINTIPLRTALFKLTDQFWLKFRKSGDMRTLKCATGVKYEIEGNRLLTNTLRRKIMSHMISGMEAKCLFDTILNSNVVSVKSFEHDGALMVLREEKIESSGAVFILKKFSDSPDFLDEE